ncbi:MAG: hypothetical protein GY940_12240 [bacterium]|nr:hypothetical protein [bacterium]
MDNNRLDHIIKKSIESSPMEKGVNVNPDMRRSVMDRIEAYELKKAARPGLAVILLYVFTMSACLVSFFFFEQVADYIKPYFKLFPAGVSLIKWSIQGLFVSIPVFLLMMTLYYWGNKRETERAA